MPVTTTDQSTPAFVPPRIVDISVGRDFIANGKRYSVSDSFAIGRLATVSLFEEEFSQAASMTNCHAVMRQAMDFINDYKPGEAWAALYNKIESDQRNARMMHYALRSCTAYINYEGEDLRYLSEETIRGKVNDWAEEGLDVRPFLDFALRASRTLLDAYRSDMEATLAEAKSVREALDQELANLSEGMERANEGPDTQAFGGNGRQPS